MTDPRFDPTSASGDPGGCLPGMVHLREFIFARWVSYRGDAGCYLHNGKTDSGNPSFHSRGRAIDVWIATGHSEVGTAIFEWCIAHRNEIGLNEVIFNRRIWRADNLSAGIHPYTVNAHTDHIHIALNLDGARGALPWFGGSDATPVPTAPEGDELTMDDEVRAAFDKVNAKLDTCLAFEAEFKAQSRKATDPPHVAAGKMVLDLHEFALTEHKAEIVAKLEAP